MVKQVARERTDTPRRLRSPGHYSTQALTAPILGVRTLSQLEDNLGALEVRFSDRQRERSEASAIELGFPHDFLARPMTRRHVFDGTRLEHHMVEPDAS